MAVFACVQGCCHGGHHDSAGRLNLHEFEQAILKLFVLGDASRGAYTHDTVVSRWWYIRWPRGDRRVSARQGIRATLCPTSYSSLPCIRHWAMVPPTPTAADPVDDARHWGTDDLNSSGDPYHSSRPLTRVVLSTDFRMPEIPQLRK